MGCGWKPVAAAGLAALGMALAGPAMAATVEGSPLEPPALTQTVADAVAARFADPAAVVIKGLKKSLARGGHGYCGQVAEKAGAEFSPFHAVLEPDAKPSILILAQANQPGGLQMSPENATQLLQHVGCVD